MNSSKITATAYYVPENKLTHQELCERFGTEAMQKVASSSGILERRVCDPQTCASDLAYRAAEDMLCQFEINRSDIDLLLFATQTPDYLIPTTACILQDRLGLPNDIGAFDINLGCSQYIYALATAHAYVSSGLAKKALVLTGDTVSRILHPEDRAVVPLFGDAGTATLVERVDTGEGGFIDFSLGTDGSGHRYLIWPTSGLREARNSETQMPNVDKSGSVRSRDDMFMDGAAVFVFTLKTIPRLVTGLLDKNSLSIEDVDLFIFHQASELIVESAAKKLSISKEKIHYKLHDLGNSGGSTVAIALTDAWLKGKIKPGMRVMLVAFGVGLSWGGSLIEWPKDCFGPVCKNSFLESPHLPSKQNC
ncbi:ketoacyl-ACP synthase III [Verrucomicrobia bacterium]|nr:ketoacyl-ACP synthase III [Verrucomicrobiota bacterium]